MFNIRKFYEAEEVGGSIDWYQEYKRLNKELTKLKEDSIPRSIAFSIANKFYGSDYPLQKSQFDNALKELGY